MGSETSVYADTTVSVFHSHGKITVRIRFSQPANELNVLKVYHS